MDTIARSQKNFSASVWLLMIAALAVFVTIGVLSYQIFRVFADPLTEGRRWIIIDQDYTLLLTLLPIGFLLVLAARMNYFRAKLQNIQSVPTPATWNRVETLMTLEEERDGRIVQRFPELLSYMVKAFEAPCLKEGVFVKVLVIARHKSIVLFSPLEDPVFSVGEIDETGKVSGSQKFPKVADAVGVFLSQTAGSA